MMLLALAVSFPSSSTGKFLRVTENVLCNIRHVDSDHGDVVVQVLIFAPG
jgi:hypothetical protein